jgi:hypothetical protein
MSQEAIEHEYQELVIEVETLGHCLSKREGIECCKRIWERMTTIDQMLQEAYPFAWGEPTDGVSKATKAAIFDVWGIDV